ARANSTLRLRTNSVPTWSPASSRFGGVICGIPRTSRPSSVCRVAASNPPRSPPRPTILLLLTPNFPFFVPPPLPTPATPPHLDPHFSDNSPQTSGSSSHPRCPAPPLPPPSPLAFAPFPFGEPTPLPGLTAPSPPLPCCLPRFPMPRSPARPRAPACIR